jgi:hypothetical protein
MPKSIAGRAVAPWLEGEGHDADAPMGTKRKPSPVSSVTPFFPLISFTLSLHENDAHNAEWRLLRSADQSKQSKPLALT